MSPISASFFTSTFGAFSYRQIQTVDPCEQFKAEIYKVEVWEANFKKGFDKTNQIQTMLRPSHKQFKAEK